MDACIEWKGAVRKDGYGITWKDGKPAYAHRVAIEATAGEVVMHSCDNRKCVNPKHLSIGSNKKNSEDMVAKGRQCSGEQSHLAKLTEEQVRHIRRLQGMISSRSCGRLFGISKTNVLDIWNKRTWKDV